jgi:hypothetical protein
MISTYSADAEKKKTTNDTQKNGAENGSLMI